MPAGQDKNPLTIDEQIRLLDKQLAKAKRSSKGFFWTAYTFMMIGLLASGPVGWFIAGAGFATAWLYKKMMTVVYSRRCERLKNQKAQQAYELVAQSPAKDKKQKFTKLHIEKEKHALEKWRVLLNAVAGLCSGVAVLGLAAAIMGFTLPFLWPVVGIAAGVALIAGLVSYSMHNKIEARDKKLEDPNSFTTYFEDVKNNTARRKHSSRSQFMVNLAIASLFSVGAVLTSAVKGIALAVTAATPLGLTITAAVFGALMAYKAVSWAINYMQEKHYQSLSYEMQKLGQTSVTPGVTAGRVKSPNSIVGVGYNPASEPPLVDQQTGQGAKEGAVGLGVKGCGQSRTRRK